CLDGEGDGTRRRSTHQEAVGAAHAERDYRFCCHGRGARGRTVRYLSVVPDAGDVLCAVRLCFQSTDRVCRATLVWPCALFRLGELFVGACREGLGLHARTCDFDRHPDPGPYL